MLRLSSRELGGVNLWYCEVLCIIIARGEGAIHGQL